MSYHRLDKVCVCVCGLGIVCVKRMARLFVHWLCKLKSAHLAYARTYIDTLCCLICMYVHFVHYNMTLQCVHAHTLQADDRDKAVLFVERYDKAIADILNVAVFRPPQKLMITRLQSRRYL